MAQLVDGDNSTIETSLDDVLVTALRENYEIKSGCHVDRNEILQFLRSVIGNHPKLGFVLQYRDTKLSSRVYKAFPKVTTKRIAVSNIRGKKIWTYTNLQRIRGQDCQEPNDAKLPETKFTDFDKMGTPSTNQKQGKTLSKRKKNFHFASMVERELLFDQYPKKFERIEKTKGKNDSPSQYSFLGRFHEMSKWIKDHFIMERNSSVQVKHVVERIRTEFKINITYKQSHKLIFSVFPGVSSYVQHPVKIETHGDCYLYEGICPKPENGSPNSNESGQNINMIHARDMLDMMSSSDESTVDNKKRVFRTRKRFIEACAVLKPAEDAIISSKQLPSTASTHMPKVVTESSSESNTYEDGSETFKDLPKNSDVLSRSEVSTIDTSEPYGMSEFNNVERCDWPRLYEEMKQDRDQAILERNQAMISLMEIEIPPQHQMNWAYNQCSKWPQRSSRSLRNHDFDEYCLGLNNRYCSGQGSSGQSMKMDRFERMKWERDALWKTWTDRITAEKDGVIQQLKLDKMEVIQRMELEKSDAVECVEEKLTNQITILTREMRELKELLNHTMNEREAVIEYAYKLKKLLDEDKLKTEGLETFPLEATVDNVIKLRRQKEVGGVESSVKSISSNVKNNKRKQTIPAKLKKSFRRTNYFYENASVCDQSLSARSTRIIDNEELYNKNNKVISNIDNVTQDSCSRDAIDEDECSNILDKNVTNSTNDLNSDDIIEEGLDDVNVVSMALDDVNDEKARVDKMEITVSSSSTQSSLLPLQKTSIDEVEDGKNRISDVGSIQNNPFQTEDPDVLNKKQLFGEKAFQGIQKSITNINGDSENSVCLVTASSKNENTRSFEESMKSTFMKYLPEISDNSHGSSNHPQSSDSPKYFQHSRNLFHDNDEMPSQENKVSSIHFLTSMVDNIGKPNVS
ncbi:uncharacterized protein LOC124458410 isoform X2 [Xenia sp. Carnegie-2017]|nr:uncharacterized protein LOC124458410 isoform X2 [Xenia sp. Carnegie-2017]